jgi:DNA-binding MarR family transcriptional regulator
MASTIFHRVRKTGGSHGVEAWTLLLELLLAERGRIPAIAATLRLSPAQCHVLRLLEPGKPVSMRRIADALSCDASNVTGIVDRLEARGLLERRAAAHDRRLRVIVVTRRGVTARARLLARLTAPPPPIARLSGAEQRALCTILRRALAPTRRG